MDGEAHNLRLPDSAADEHDFWKLGPKRFEHLARALHGAQPEIFGESLYGPDGQAQFGVDHVAHRQSAAGIELEVGQSKAYKKFTAAQVIAAANAFAEHWEEHWRPKNVRRFVLFVGCAIKSRSTHDEILAQTERFAAMGLEFVVWDANAIYDRLAHAPAVVRGHLGHAWYERLFGEQVGPLTGLRRDLEAGDFGAANVAAYVGQLNRAQSAQIEELKRAIRRGELDESRATLEQTLFQSPAAAASAADTRASLLRLLASLLIRERSFERAKTLLDEADSLDGDKSERARAVLTMEAIGPAEALAQTDGATEPEIVEVRAIAHLRLGEAEQAILELSAFEANSAKAETLRLLALLNLLTGDRQKALDLAQQAAGRDSESRACAQMLGICHFHRALSVAVEPTVGEWPHPVDQPLVKEDDGAAADLNEAVRIFSDLAQNEKASDQRSMKAWALGALACLPKRRDEAQLALQQLLEPGSFIPSAVAWALARGLEFDQHDAAARLDALLVENPLDIEARLIRVALASHAKEPKIARRVLGAGKTAFEASGNQPAYLYWLAVLEIEAGRQPAAEAIEAYPWLALRAALRERSRKKRLVRLDKIAKRAAEPGGDRRVLMAAVQQLHEGGWHKTGADCADILIQEIGTAEAIALAAHLLYWADRPSAALEALSHLSAFPDGRLPIDLERLRVAALAASGELLEASRQSGRLAESTLSPRDIWHSIHLQMTMGAIPAALALYDRHADKLGAPHPGHLQLANLALHHNREAAIRITRTIAQSVPDDLVTAAFTLASKLHLVSEQRLLIGRIHELGARGAGGVQLISDVSAVVEMVTQRRAAADEANEKYLRGHIPVHALARSNPAALAETYLGRLLVPAPAGVIVPPLFARYGRRYENLWPDRAKDVSLVADVTALLTAQGLGILDAVERTFRPIRVAPDVQNALAHIRSHLEPAQPSRLEAMRSVLGMIVTGELACRSGEPEIDSFKVVWEIEGAEPQSTLNLSRLVELIPSRKAADIETIRLELGDTIHDPAQGPVVPKGSHICLDPGMAVTLAEAGGLPPLGKAFRLTIDQAELTDLQAAVRTNDDRELVLKSLNQLADRLAAGIEDETYRFVPPTTEHDDPVTTAYFQVLSSMRQPGSILWVDDRFTSAIDAPQFKTASTAEVLQALVKYKRLEEAIVFAHRQRLRDARWLFLSAESDEIVHYLRAAVSDGEINESEDLAVLRRASAMALVERRLIQFPDAEAAKQGIKGEVPFLLDSGHTAAQVLLTLWTDESLSVEDAAAASQWTLEYLDSELMPLAVIPTGDPRSDLMVTLHLAQLVMIGIQFLPPTKKQPRLVAYFKWLWDAVIDRRIRVRPEMEKPFEDAIERYMLDLENDTPAEEDLWLKLAGNLIDRLPKPTRTHLLQRDKIRRAFNGPDHGNISIDDIDIDEVEFWKATSDAVVGQSIRVRTIRGEFATLKLLPSEGNAPSQFSLTLGKRKMRIDDWPNRAAASGRTIRHKAIAEKNERLDLADDELNALADEMGKLRPSWKRPMEVMRRAGRSMASWYAELQNILEKREPFKVSGLIPPSVDAMLRHLRLSHSVDAAVETLLQDRGLMLAVQRWSGVPVAPPGALYQALAVAEDSEISHLLDAAEGELEPVWTKAFLTRLLWERSGSDHLMRDRLEALLLEFAESDEAANQWALLSRIARYLSAELHRLDGWHDQSPLNQLAIIWGHAGELARLFLIAGVEPESMAQWFENHRLVSPRLLTDDRTKYAGDFANPTNLLPARLSLYAVGPMLVEVVNRRSDDEGPVRALSSMLISQTPNGNLPRPEIMQAGLCADDALGSYLAFDLGGIIDGIFSGARIISGDGLRDLVRDSLAEPPGSRASRAAWVHLRGISGDGPIDRELLKLAKQKVAEVDLTSREDGITHAREVLLALAALAEANEWRDLGSTIDAASVALSEDDGTEDANASTELLLEAAFWRARLEVDSDKRAAILAKDIERLAQDPRLASAAEAAAANFAAGLAGQEAAPFVDILARFRAKR